MSLSDGTVLQLTATTRTVRTDRATVADLKPGLFLAAGVTQSISYQGP